jgi:hypothetical protein
MGDVAVQARGFWFDDQNPKHRRKAMKIRMGKLEKYSLAVLVLVMALAVSGVGMVPTTLTMEERLAQIELKLFGGPNVSGTAPEVYKVYTDAQIAATALAASAVVTNPSGNQTIANAHQLINTGGFTGPSITSAGNGATSTSGSSTELLTLSTIAQTTDTSANLLPAGSVIDAVVGRVTTTITASCTGWELGDASVATRFTSNDTTLTSGETAIGASATAQAAAAKVRVTCAGGNPGAGAIRITVFYHQFVAPTS